MYTRVKGEKEEEDMEDMDVRLRQHARRIRGTSCTALVDTGSNATLVRPDIVPVGVTVEAMTVRLKTVTGDLAPIKGRRFVRGVLSIAAPLFRLLQKDCVFSWSPECQQAFDTLRRALTESPVLVPPDPALPFVLDTDASNVGLGAVLSQSYYLGLQRRDVEDFCRSCDACSSHKGPLDQSRAQLQQQPAGAPMERVAVDIMGPFPCSDWGNRYVLAAMDYFTKWPEAYAIPDQEAETVADSLVEGMFNRFGTAGTIHSDQGRNLESCVFAAMCERLDMHKTRTTPLHPQSDGLVERFNWPLGQQLAILMAEHQRDWDVHLSLILLAYRSAVQDSTACTPALLMLGRELRTPAELAFGYHRRHQMQHLGRTTPGNCRSGWRRRTSLPETS
ncbi:Retrovirus-related Pol poly from transposon [Solea senegalensis]|uniref:Retrovirus-related Pol poly from transposon n=1 Tax=Solea senegalensis TaxID=28829 RepID=A0AAV6PLG0_SOLSE|nr:Retrovirus-related Pol poly from transposon [Solea senegalensis]